MKTKPCKCLICQPRQLTWLERTFFAPPFKAKCATRYMLKRVRPALEKVTVVSYREIL